MYTYIIFKTIRIIFTTCCCIQIIRRGIRTNNATLRIVGYCSLVLAIMGFCQGILAHIGWDCTQYFSTIMHLPDWRIYLEYVLANNLFVTFQRLWVFVGILTSLRCVIYEEALHCRNATWAVRIERAVWVLFIILLLVTLGRALCIYDIYWFDPTEK